MEYEYRFERIETSLGSVGYQDAVQTAAREGWRLIQLFIEQPAIVATSYVLVLERPLRNQIAQA